MIKYAKVINNETGLCEVGLSTNKQFYRSIGMKELDVQQSDIDGNWYLAYMCPMKTDEQKSLEEKERIAKLFLTGADVERGIYQAKGMDFEDIVALVTQIQPAGLDIKALKIELKANNFYRGNPYVSAIGALLGFSDEQLDKFFEFNDYFYLMNFDLEVKTTPENAIVKINGVETKTASLPFDSEYVCEISCEEYITQTLNGKIQNDEYVEVVLEANTPTEELNIEN